MRDAAVWFYSALNLNQDKAESRRQYKQYGTEFVGAPTPYKIVLFELRRTNEVLAQI